MWLIFDSFKLYILQVLTKWVIQFLTTKFVVAYWIANALHVKTSLVKDLMSVSTCYTLSSHVSIGKHQHRPGGLTDVWPRRRRGPRRGQCSSAWGRWCGMAGWGRGASLLVLLAPRWRSDGGIDEGAVAVVSKRSRHGAAVKGSRHGSDDDDDGVPMVAVCAPVASLMVV
jgi:hypothetical protein